jgi:hypothetical protein
MDIVRDYLHLIKNEFHAGDERAFFQQRWLLIKAISQTGRISPGAGLSKDPGHRHFWHQGPREQGYDPLLREILVERI